MLISVRHHILDLMVGNILKLLLVCGLAQYFHVRSIFLVDGEMYVRVNIGSS